MKLKTWIREWLYLSPLPVDLTEKLLFFATHRYWPNLASPKNFAEKIVWRKTNRASSIPLAELSDKLAVRNHVKRQIGESHLVPLLFSGPEISAEELLELGDDIVVKLNNDCGSTEIIEENTLEKASAISKRMNRRTRRDFGKLSNQWWYSDIKPMVIVEKWLKDWDDSAPIEYQLFLFRKPNESDPTVLFSISIGRRTENHRLNYFDQNGDEFLFNGQHISSKYRNGGFPFPDPEKCSELIRVADELSKGIDHVRVDLYLAKDQIYFGEMTFSSGNGRIKWNPAEFDTYLGSLWDLDLD